MTCPQQNSENAQQNASSIYRTIAVRNDRLTFQAQVTVLIPAYVAMDDMEMLPLHLPKGKEPLDDASKIQEDVSTDEAQNTSTSFAEGMLAATICLSMFLGQAGAAQTLAPLHINGASFGINEGTSDAGQRALLIWFPAACTWFSYPLDLFGAMFREPHLTRLWHTMNPC